MKPAFTAFWVITLLVVVLLAAWVGYLYLINRTVDQTLATNLRVSNDWTELSADRPLTAFRTTQELVIAIPNYRLDRDERLPTGQIRLPDGRISNPEVEGIDTNGNTVRFRFRGHTLSERDYIVFTPIEDLDSKKVAKIRIRSNESFTTEQIFWRNRNPK